MAICEFGIIKGGDKSRENCTLDKILQSSMLYWVNFMSASP